MQNILAIEEVILKVIDVIRKKKRGRTWMEAIFNAINKSLVVTEKSGMSPFKDAKKLLLIRK